MADKSSTDADDIGRTNGLAIISCVGPVISVVLIVNRYWWRYRLRTGIGTDDICIFLAWWSLLVMCTANYFGIAFGYGQRHADLDPDEAKLALISFFINQITYKFAINLTKLSVVRLYLRIFYQKWFVILCKVMQWVILAYGISSIVANVFQCIPVNATWDKSIDGFCIDLTSFWYANAAYSILTDSIIFLAVPVVVWSLKVSRAHRICLILLLSLVGVTFGISIVRLVTLKSSSTAKDVTYGTLETTFWSTLEASLAIICACLPMLRQAVGAMIPRLMPEFPTSEDGGEEGGIELENMRRE